MSRSPPLAAGSGGPRSKPVGNGDSGAYAGRRGTAGGIPPSGFDSRRRYDDAARLRRTEEHGGGQAVRNSIAARLASALRDGMKDQALSVAAVAERVREATGKHYPHQYASRRLTGVRPLVVVSDDLFPICEALGLDAGTVVGDAVRQEAEARRGESR